MNIGRIAWIFQEHYKNGPNGYGLFFCGQTLADVPKISAVFFLVVVVNSHYRQTSDATLPTSVNDLMALSLKTDFC